VPKGWASRNSHAFSCSEAGAPQCPELWLQSTMKEPSGPSTAASWRLVSPKLTMTLSPAPPCMVITAGTRVRSSMGKVGAVMPPELGAAAAT
jgi:hypothetical protein